MTYYETNEKHLLDEYGRRTELFEWERKQLSIKP